jgi:hypothetical protein
MDKLCSIIQRPIIKIFDTRCSFKCVQNWTKYNQTPPIGHYCECNKNYFNYKN